jgi:hypothetical protein
VNLPAFLLSKNLVPDSLGGFDLRRSILLAEDRAIFSNNCRQKRPIKYKTRRRAPGLAAIVLAASREAQLVLSRANKAPHYRICSLEYFRPDCEFPALHDPTLFREHRAICNLTKALKYVKSPPNLFFLPFHTPVEPVGNHGGVQGGGSVHQRKLFECVRAWGRSRMIGIGRWSEFEVCPGAVRPQA